MRRKKLPELALPRRLFHKILPARASHGDFADCHRHFKHIEAKLKSVYGHETSPTYFVRSREYAT